MTAPLLGIPSALHAVCPAHNVATFDATDYDDQAEAEQHARSYSLTCEGSVNVNVHPMGYSPCVAYRNGVEVWRATPQAIALMSREGIALLRMEARR